MMWGAAPRSVFVRVDRVGPGFVQDLFVPGGVVTAGAFQGRLHRDGERPSRGVARGRILPGMRMRVESHRYAEDVLATRFQEEWDQLRDVLGNLEPSLRPAGPYTRQGRPKTPKRQMRAFGGRRANVLLPIDQSAMNEGIDAGLVERGWDRQPWILVDRDGQPIDTRLRGDFEKSGVFVEVEFGNVASLYRDLFKFHIAGSSGAAEVGVIVVATAQLAAFFDQGQATWETATGLLPYMRAGLQLPTAIVGVDVKDWSGIAARYNEMLVTLTANGETGHPFEAVLREPAPSDPTLE